jgi:hypothetical protein
MEFKQQTLAKLDYIAKKIAQNESDRRNHKSGLNKAVTSGEPYKVYENSFGESPVKNTNTDIKKIKKLTVI